jgi:hypothetical protein
VVVTNRGQNKILGKFNFLVVFIHKYLVQPIINGIIEVYNEIEKHIYNYFGIQQPILTFFSDML